MSGWSRERAPPAPARCENDRELRLTGEHAGRAVSPRESKSPVYNYH
jgi:hypothetical protein